MARNKSNSNNKRKNKLNHIRNLIEARNYKRALYEIINYLNTYPEDVLGHYLYGKLLLRKNELQEARRQFQLVIEYQDENEVKALMNLATIARREGDPEEAIKYYKKVIELTRELVHYKRKPDGSMAVGIADECLCEQVFTKTQLQSCPPHTTKHTPNSLKLGVIFLLKHANFRKTIKCITTLYHKMGKNWTDIQDSLNEIQSIM